MNRSKAGGWFSNFENYLNVCHLVEQETLNGVSPAGSCQFSSISYKLFGQLCTNDYRLDLLLVGHWVSIQAHFLRTGRLL